MMAVVTELALAVGSSVELALLVKTTLVLLGATVLLLAMPHASASSRHLVVAAAFGILLLLPVAAALMPPIAIEIPRPSRPLVAITPATGGPLPDDQTNFAGETISLPTAHQGAALNRPITAANSIRIRPVDLFRATWLAGVFVFVAPVLLALWRGRSLRRTAVVWPHDEALARELADQARIAQRVQVLRHEGVPAPMTCGIIRPAVLLPWDASDWTEEEVRHALIHELEHVRRGDWLAQILARCVCAVYWFHPLVWRAWRHLHLEAERACDDAVVRHSDGATYAAQLVHLAERMSGRNVRPILAMASQGDLSARVRSVLDTRRRRDRAGAWWTIGAMAPALLSLWAIAPLRAVTVEVLGDRLLPRVPGPRSEVPAPTAQAPTASQALVPAKTQNAPLERAQIPEDRFDTAIVRRGITILPGIPIPATVMEVRRRRPIPTVTFDENEFTATGVSIQELIERAYGIGMVGTRPRPFASIEGTPTWTERFDVDARMPRPLPRENREPAALRTMLQHLLATRFNLVAHWEPREKLVYELLREGPLGPRLRPSADCPLGKCLPSCFEVPQICQGGGGYWGRQSDTTRSHLMAGLPMSAFTRNLEIDLVRPVIDRTELEGPYNLELQYSSPRQNGGRVTLTAAPPNDPWQIFSDALREQLGLRLEPRTVSEDVLIIDRIALPSYDSP